MIDNSSDTPPGERTPLSDLTNTGASATNGTKKTNWYSRLSADKKKEHLEKLRIARQQKKLTSLSLANKGSNDLSPSS
jgi:hypothetical protein